MRASPPEVRRRRLDGVAAAIPVAGILAIDPGGRSPFGPAKWALLPTVVLAAWCAGLRTGRSVDRRTARWWAVALAWVGVSAAVGLDRVGAWIGTPERRYGALTWLLCAASFAAGQLLDAEGRRTVRRTVTVIAGLLGAWAVAELSGWEPVALTGAGSRPVGPLGSSAYLGAAALLTGAIALGEAVSAGDRRWRRIATACAALAIVALLASGARAAWVGAIAGLAVVAVARRARPRAAHLAVGAAFVLGVVFATGVAGRLPAVVTDERGGAHGRLDEWRVAVRVVAEHPVVGTGPEGYRIAFGPAVDDAYEQEHGRVPLPDRAHSAPLDVAATLGLPGLVLVVALLLSVVRWIRRALHGDATGAAVAAAVAAYAVQALFLFPLAELDPTAWLLAGTCVTAGRRVRSGGARVAAAIAAAVAAVGLGVAGAIGVVADRRARSGDAEGAVWLRPDVVPYGVALARAHEDVGSSAALDRAIDAVEDTRRFHDRDPVVVAERGRLLLDRARRTGTPRHVRAARDALESAARHDPRNAQLLLRLGLARSLDADDAGAEQAWRRAERLAPRSPEASVDLALLHVRLGRTTEARAAATRALTRDPDHPVAKRVLSELDGT